MPEFDTTLRDLQSKLRVIATGAFHGVVLQIAPKKDDTDSENAFKALVAALAGGLAAGTALIFRSLHEGSTSQALVVHSAKLSDLPGAAALALSGYCVEARKGSPESQEPYNICDPLDQTAFAVGLLGRTIQEGEGTGTELADTYAFVSPTEAETGIFARRFTQALVWITTDDIGYLRARETVFGASKLEVMFFAPGCFEVMLELRASLKRLAFPLRQSRYDNELMASLGMNIKWGLVPQDHLESWQDRYGFSFAQD